MASGGMIVRRSGGGGLVFVPADVALALVDLTAFTEVLGLVPPATGIAVAEGDIVTVFDLGADAAGASGTDAAPQSDAPPVSSRRGGPEWPIPGADRAILCDVDGQRVALTGGVVVETGFFDTLEDGGVRWRGRSVPRLDVRVLMAQAEAAVWAARALGRPLVPRPEPSSGARP